MSGIFSAPVLIVYQEKYILKIKSIPCYIQISNYTNTLGIKILHEIKTLIKTAPFTSNRFLSGTQTRAAASIFSGMNNRLEVFSILRIALLRRWVLLANN